jgi:phosphoribosylanthranilate isomerase
MKPVRAKICGVSTAEAVAAALGGGASHVGFVFYPPSPRAVTPAQAAALAAVLPPEVGRVALLVDPDDAAVDAVLAELAVDLLQLHGSESPARVAEIRARFGRPVMKAIKVGAAADVAAAEAYLGVADWLLFDARAPAARPGALPGGNALSFDWRWLAGRAWPLPWMLSGGLHAGNVAEAVRITGARQLDVSSGVEEGPGRKSPVRIAAFLAAVAALG